MSLWRSAPRRAAPWVCSSCAARLSTSARVASRELQKGKQHIKIRLPDSPARTRFAPSPTGYLHLGSLRTALYNYLLAKATGGQFLLRLEDTDQKRTIAGAEQRLYQDLRWAGLQWDEGPEVGGPYGPYRQSERTELYQDHTHRLLESGHAYRCFCSPERLNALATQRAKLGLPTDYDRTCADIPQEESRSRASKGESFVVRLRVPEVYPMFDDLVYGKVGKGKGGPLLFKHGEPAYEDPILLKSDGQPTYHLANVVDDHHMKVTHVVRAAEWMSSTPKHVILYQAFNWTPPTYAHVGLLQDQQGQKLSKRNLDLDIATIRDQWDIFPEALNNFVALLGWSHHRGNDRMTMEDLIDTFDLKFTRGNTIVTFEKLWFLQKEHARRYAAREGQEFNEMVDKVQHLARTRIDSDERAKILGTREIRPYVAAIVQSDAKSYTTAEEFLQRNIIFFKPVRNSIYSTIKENGQPYHTVPRRELVEAANCLSAVQPQDWSPENLKLKIEELVVQFSGISEEKIRDYEPRAKGDARKEAREWNKALHHYLRWAVAEGRQGPGIAETMVILGRDVTLERLEDATILAGGSSDGEPEIPVKAASAAS